MRFKAFVFSTLLMYLWLSVQIVPAQSPKTNILVFSRTVEFRLSASTAADIIIRAMEKNKYRVTVGKDATLLDILYRLSPKRASRFIGKMMKKTLSQT